MKVKVPAEGANIARARVYLITELEEYLLTYLEKEEA